MRKTTALGCAALLLGALGPATTAEIKALTLEEMVHASDSAVYGQIIASHVTRVDSDLDGPELYYTTLTIQGQTLDGGQFITVDVKYAGGFINATEGVYNSEAPAADDVRVGKNVVAFYRWCTLAGGVAGNALVASHGGIYRTLDGPKGAAVLGRGPGYAVSANVRLEQLEIAVREINKAAKR